MSERPQGDNGEDDDWEEVEAEQGDHGDGPATQAAVHLEGVWRGRGLLSVFALIKKTRFFLYFKSF